MISRKFSEIGPARPSVFTRRAALGLAAMLLGTLLPGCAPVTPRPPVVGSEAMQVAREAELASQPNWSFSGRLAVSQGGDGGNARVEWRQHGPDFDIQLSAPVTRQSWRLRQTAGKVRLDGLQGGTREGSNAEAMLQEATGWRIPLTAMAAWVRGVRAAGPSDMSFDAYGLPATIRQQGWSVEYRGWQADVPALPQKVFARQGEATVRLVVERWHQP